MWETAVEDHGQGHPPLANLDFKDLIESKALILDTQKTQSMKNGRYMLDTMLSQEENQFQFFIIQLVRLKWTAANL